MTSEITFNVETKRAGLAKRVGRYVPAGVRILLGVLFFVVGLNGYVNFLPQPTTPMPVGATAFLGALINTGYMLALISGTQLIVGALLLANRFVPLALTLLAPFVVNSIAFHLFLEPTGRPMAIVVLGMELYLAWVYREAFRPLLRARVVPGGQRSQEYGRDVNGAGKVPAPTAGEAPALRYSSPLQSEPIHLLDIVASVLKVLPLPVRVMWVTPCVCSLSTTCMFMVPLPRIPSSMLQAILPSISVLVDFRMVTSHCWSFFSREPWISSFLTQLL